MQFDAFCLRCDRFFSGEQCPGCDGDDRSEYVDPPDWYVPDTAETPRHNPGRCDSTDP